MNITIFIPTNKNDFTYLWTKIKGVSLKDFNAKKGIRRTPCRKSFVEDRQFINPSIYCSVEKLNEIKMEMANKSGNNL